MKFKPKRYKRSKRSESRKSNRFHKIFIILLLYYIFYILFFNQKLYIKIQKKISNTTFKINKIDRFNMTEKTSAMIKLSNDLAIPKNRKKMLMNGKKYIDRCLNESEKFKEYKIKVKPTLSVIIPTFNCEKTINTAINSIQNQNFTDFEIILINDFSKDKTEEIILSRKEKDSRIKIINNKKNMGSLYSRCIGVLISKGKYIFPLDDDDIFFVEDIFDFVLTIAIDNNLDIVGFRAIQMKNFRDDINKMGDLYYYHHLDNLIIYQPELSRWMITMNGRLAMHDVTIWCKCIKTKIYKYVVNRLGVDRYSIFVSWAEDTLVNVILFNFAQSFIFIRKYGIVHWLSGSTATFVQPNNVRLFGDLYVLDVLYDFSKNEDKNYAVTLAYGIKRSYRVNQFHNNTNLIYFRSIIQKLSNSPYITNENKQRINRDFSFFLA